MANRRFCRPPRLQDALPLPGQVPSSMPAPPIRPAAPSGRRILALHLPWLATQRLRLPADRPAACWEAAGSRRLLTAVTPAAATAGLTPGQAVADAQALLPDLLLVPAEREADTAWLHDLALWCLALTPLPAPDPPAGLLLDVTGIDHLHGGESTLLRHALRRFARAGVTAQGAIAGNAAAAAALARTTPGAIIAPGGEEVAMRPLPLGALRLPEAQVAALHRMGVRRIGDALALPRGPLARRFGAALVATLDAAAGLRAVPIQPLRPPPDYAVRREFLEPIQTREAIDAVLAQLLDALCRQLADAQRGTRRMALLAFRVDGTVQEVAAESGRAQRDARHFARLFRERLERLAPGFGFEPLVLEAASTEPLDLTQAALHTGTGIAAEQRAAALAQLLDRLSQRVPVWRLAPRLSHWPERAVKRVGAFDRVTVPEGWPGPAPRPVRLLRRPIPLQAMALLPDAPPSLLRTPREAWRVTRAEGPERLAPEWWRDPRPDRPFRDYYRVELSSGARLWVVRSGLTGPDGGPAQWWLHGRFG